MARELKGKKILVTGATGFIGSHVCLRLLEEGAIVKGMARNLEKASVIMEKGASVIQGNMADHQSLENAVKGCDMIFHFAGILADEYRSWAYYRKVNTEGTKALAELALKQEVELFLHTSTVWVYGIDTAGRVSENSPLRFSNTRYCDTKLEGEKIVKSLAKEKGLPAVVIQPTDVYGPGDETYILQPLKMIRNGTMVLPGRGKGLINPIYIDDLVDGIILAARNGETGETYILGTRQDVTVSEFFGYLAEMIGKPPEFICIPAWLVFLAASMAEIYSSVTGLQPIFTKETVYGVLMKSEYDSGKAYRELGFAPKVDLQKGMEFVRNWVKNLKSF